MAGIIRFLIVWLLAFGGDAAAQGYRLLGDRVEVSRAGHWQDWTVPRGTSIIRADGTVEPRFMLVATAAEWRRQSRRRDRA